MSKSVKIILAVILVAAVFKQDKIREYLGLGQVEHDETLTIATNKKEEFPAPDIILEKDDPTPETIYRWDDELINWVEVERSSGFRAQLVSNTTTHHSTENPIEVDWKLLMDIEYTLQYFAELDMEMYAPVFPEAVEALHEKEVIIEGFVIPFEEEGGLLSLSFNPYASCFFCGKASPASVMSMHMKSKRNRYKTDDFKKFKGVLYLNQNDPNEFYYILRDAKEV